MKLSARSTDLLERPQRTISCASSSRASASVNNDRLGPNRQLKRIAESGQEDREERCIAKVVVVACDKGRQIPLETRVFHNSLTPDRLWILRIAGAAGEVDFQPGLPNIVKPCLHRKA